MGKVRIVLFYFFFGFMRVFRFFFGVEGFFIRVVFCVFSRWFSLVFRLWEEVWGGVKNRIDDDFLRDVDVVGSGFLFGELLFGVWLGLLRVRVFLNF